MIIFLLFSSTPSTPHFTLFPYTTLFRSLPQRGHDLLAVAGVQRRGRLIAQQDPRPGRQGPGDRHALLLTAGEDRKSTRLNSSYVAISYAGFCVQEKTGVDPRDGVCARRR